MFNRLPAVAAGAALAALVGGGITYATADDTHSDERAAAPVRNITKSISYSGYVLEEDAELGYTIIGSWAGCPRGTHMTGGGFDDLTDGITYQSNPAFNGRERWYAFTIGSYGQDPADFLATVTCYGPANKFGGNFYKSSGVMPKSAEIPAAVAQRALRRAPGR